MKLTTLATALVLTVATPMAAMAATPAHKHHAHKHDHMKKTHGHVAKKAHDANDSAPAEEAKISITQHAG